MVEEYSEIVLVVVRYGIDLYKSVAGNHCNKFFNEGHEQQDRPLSRECHKGAVQNHGRWAVGPN